MLFILVGTFFRSVNVEALRGDVLWNVKQASPHKSSLRPFKNY